MPDLGTSSPISPWGGLMFKLTRQRAATCGVHCLEDGLYLGSAALIERDEHRGYRTQG
jgi:hypothetical protein